MGKLSKVMGFPSGGLGSEPDALDQPDELEEAPESDAKGAGKAEVIAMRAFMKADTAEGKASALKDFLELCDY